MGAPRRPRLPVYEVTDSALQHLDVHDGTIADWLAYIGPPSILATDLSRSVDPGDLDFRIWLGWHDASDRLFVAMERTDDDYTNDYTLEHACNCAMESFDSGLGFAVDGDHSGGPFNGYANGWSDDEAYTRSLQQGGQAYMAIAETFDGCPALRSGFLDSQYGRWWYALPPWADGGGGRFGEQPTVTVTEFYVTPMGALDPFDDQMRDIVDLRPNAVVGLYFYVADFDDSPVLMVCGSGVDSWWQPALGRGQHDRR